MTDEMISLHVNNTQTLVKKPKDVKLVQCKWLFKVKEGLTEGEPVRYKARLVVKGFTQREGIDFNEIFSPMVKFKTIRVMLAKYDLEIEQLNVKTKFLHGELDKMMYMHQLEGFNDKRLPDHVCMTKKSLYGLKQSPRQ